MAHLLSLFVLLVVGVVGHSRQELQEAVERVAVACWEHVDQQLCDMLLLICIQHWRRKKNTLQRNGDFTNNIYFMSAAIFT